MVTKQIETWKIVFAIAVIIAFFSYTGFLGSVIAPQDDFVTFDDFSTGVLDLEYTSLKENDEPYFPFEPLSRAPSLWAPDYPSGTVPTFRAVWEPGTHSAGSAEGSAYSVIGEGDIVRVDILSWFGGGLYLPQINENHELVLRTRQAQNTAGNLRHFPRARIEKDIKGIDLKFDLDFYAPTYSTSPFQPRYRILLNDVQVYSYSFGDVGGIPRSKFNVEFRSHLLDQNLIDLYVKGIYYDTFNITDDEVYVHIVPTMGTSFTHNREFYTYISNIRYKLKFSCMIYDNEKVVTETYSAGEVIALDREQRFSSDGCVVRRLCRQHKAYIYGEGGSTMDERDEIYDNLVMGRSLTVPAGETWQLSFITAEDATGRCEDYVGPDTFTPVEIGTHDPKTQRILPGGSYTWESETINVGSLPNMFRATFVISAQDDHNNDKTKEEAVVIKK